MGDIILSVGREQPVPYRARLMGMKEHDVCLQKDMGGRSDCLSVADAWQMSPLNDKVPSLMGRGLGGGFGPGWFPVRSESRSSLILS